MVNLASFWKPETCGQTVLPDGSLFLGQKLVKSAEISSETWLILVPVFVSKIPILLQKS